MSYKQRAARSAMPSIIDFVTHMPYYLCKINARRTHPANRLTGPSAVALRAMADKLLFYIQNSFLFAVSSFLIVLPPWGRNGFDGDKEALAAYRAPIDSLNRWELNVIADDYELALAA